MDSIKRKFRIGNIGVLPYINDDKYACEIVCYYPNPYYGKDDEYPEYQPDPNFRVYPDHPHCKVHKDCFKHEESCYVVAYATCEEESDIISVGPRPWELNDEDKASFETVIKKLFALERGESDDPQED